MSSSPLCVCNTTLCVCNAMIYVLCYAGWGDGGDVKVGGGMMGRVGGGEWGEDGGGTGWPEGRGRRVGTPSTPASQWLPPKESWPKKVCLLHY